MAGKLSRPSLSQAQQWGLVAALAGVLVLVAGWLFLIAPQRATAAQLRADKLTQDAANDQLRGRIAMLQAQAKDLPAMEQRLQEVRRHLPNTPALPELVRELNALARQSGVRLLTVSPERPTPLAGGSAAGAATAPTGAATRSAAGPAAAETVYAVPLTMEVAGRYTGLTDYLEALEELERAFLATGIKVSSEAAGSSGQSKKPGEVNLSITARVFTTSPQTPAAGVDPGSAAGSTTGPIPAPTATPTPDATLGGPVPAPASAE